MAHCNGGHPCPSDHYLPGVQPKAGTEVAEMAMEPEMP